MWGEKYVSKIRNLSVNLPEPLQPVIIRFRLESTTSVGKDFTMTPIISTA